MTGEGKDSGELSRVDEDPFEKQMILVNESQIDHLEECLKETPIPYISTT